MDFYKNMHCFKEKFVLKERFLMAFGHDGTTKMMKSFITNIGL